MDNNFGIKIDRSLIMRIAVYLILMILLSYINATILDFIQVGDVIPDIVLILVIFIVIREGQFIGLFAGFTAGLLMDIISLDVIGTNSLAKVTAAYIAGFFYKESKHKQILSGITFLLVVLLSAFIHNLLYFFFYVKVSNLNLMNFFLKYGIASTLYTTVIAILPVLLNFRRREINV